MTDRKTRCRWRDALCPVTHAPNYLHLLGSVTLMHRRSVDASEHIKIHLPVEAPVKVDLTFFVSVPNRGSPSVESLFMKGCFDRRLNIPFRFLEGDAGGLGDGNGTSASLGGWNTDMFGCCSYTLASTSPALVECASSSTTWPDVPKRILNALLTLDNMVYCIRCYGRESEDKSNIPPLPCRSVPLQDPGAEIIWLGNLGQSRRAVSDGTRRYYNASM